MEQSNSKLKDLNFNLRRHIFNFLPYSDLINVYYINKGLLMHAYDLVNFKQILNAYLFLHNIIMMNFREERRRGKYDEFGRRGLKWIKYINNFEGVDIICFLLKRFPLFSKEIIIQALITFFTDFRQKYKNNLILLNPECLATPHKHFYEIYSKVLQNLNKDDFVYDVPNDLNKSNEVDEILSHVKYIQHFSTDLLENPNCDNFKFKHFYYDNESSQFPNDVENLSFYCEADSKLLEEFIKDHKSTIKTIRGSYWFEKSFICPLSEPVPVPVPGVGRILARRTPAKRAWEERININEDEKKVFIQNLSLFSNLNTLSLPNDMSWGNFINKVKFPDKLKRIYFNKDNGILRMKEPFPNLKEIGGMTLDSKENKTDFLKFISVNNNITKLTNLKFNSICGFTVLIKELSILNLKVLDLTIGTHTLFRKELKVTFDLIKNTFKDLKMFKLKLLDTPFSNKFIIESVIDIQDTALIPFDLIVHVLKNTKLPFYNILIDDFRNLNKFLNYLEINKEFQILKKIKGLEYEENPYEKKSQKLKINHPLKLYRLSLNNYEDLNKFKSVETLRLVLKSIPTIEIIKKINTKKLLSLSIYCEYDYEGSPSSICFKMEEVENFMKYFVNNYKKEFNQVVHLCIYENLNGTDKGKRAKSLKKLKNILSTMNLNYGNSSNYYKI